MIKYTVIESQRKVIAKLDGCALDVVNLIKKKAGVEFESDELMLKCTYKGVAKCHPEDEFNVEEGKKVAKAKLLEKYNKAFNKALMNATDILYVLFESISDVEEKYIR